MNENAKIKKLFKNLRKDEIEFILDVPVLISLLIAGAENAYNEVELEQAKFFTQIREAHDREELEDYYHAVSDRFEERLAYFRKMLDTDNVKRKDELFESLSRLNQVLPILEPKFQVELYSSLKTYARHIAEASGGILGYFAVTPEELKLIELPMINHPELEED